jgi:blocked-early-in-transport protein 1
LQTPIPERAHPLYKPPPQPCPKPTNARGILPSPQSTTNPPIQLTTSSTRQNNDSLASLQAKVSQLRSVTVDIYDNARDQHVIDNTSESFSNMTTSIKGSARRLGVMASQGNKIAVFKLAGIIVATVVVLWWILSWFW